MKKPGLSIAIVVGFVAVGAAAMAQNAAPQQPAPEPAPATAQQPGATPPGATTPATTTPAAPPARGRGNPAPTRDPQTPGYVQATMLPDGAVPPADAIGNFVIGPTHAPSPDTQVQPGVPQGTVYNFTMESTDSKIYPGFARVP
jgi:hypothetical protein